MSHFDDVDGLLWIDPRTPAGVIIWLVVAVLAVGWAIWANEESENTCQKLGEVYVDSRADYTLCKDDAGVVRSR